MSYVYEYPRPMVTVDIFLLRIFEERIHTLLVQRNKPPYQGKWALPGGFIEMDETILESATRELEEETNIQNIPLFPLITEGDPGRDPRGRTITILYGGVLEDPSINAKAGTDAGHLDWFPLDDLPSLSFDHQILVQRAFSEFNFRAVWRLWLLLFLPDKFKQNDYNFFHQILFGHDKYFHHMKNVAIKLKWIREESNHFFIKLVNNRQILDTRHEKIADTWFRNIPI